MLLEYIVSPEMLGCVGVSCSRRAAWLCVSPLGKLGTDASLCSPPQARLACEVAMGGGLTSFAQHLAVVMETVVVGGWLGQDLGALVVASERDAEESSSERGGDVVTRGEMRRPPTRCFVSRSWESVGRGSKSGLLMDQMASPFGFSAQSFLITS